MQGYSLESRRDVQPSMGGSEGAASQPADPIEMPSSEENANTIVGSLDIMWQWAHQLTQGLSVTSTSWNKVGLWLGALAEHWPFWLYGHCTRQFSMLPDILMCTFDKIFPEKHKTGLALFVGPGE